MFQTTTKMNSYIEYMMDLPRWHYISIGLATYVAYYFLQAVKRPILACSNGPFKQFLMRKMPTLETKYWPTIWCVESRAQTIFASLLRSQIAPKVQYRREILSLKDGGEVALDWLEDGCNEDAPCIIILPGMTGESQADYIKCLVTAANHVGMKTVVFNNRGFGGITLKTPRLYCASNCEDMSEVVHHVRRNLPGVKIGATGISMGGLILGNYLIRKSEEAASMITAAKIISVPWDIPKAVISIERPFLNILLCRHLASEMCRTLSSCEIFKETNIDLPTILSSKTIKEFDTRFTAKQFGYDHVDDYYNDSTLHNKLEQISVPTLCLSAADDPFQPMDAIPIQAAEESTHVAIVITARGGHIGFLEGWWPSNPKEQYMGRVFTEFFTRALYDTDGEFEHTAAMMRACYLAKQSQITKITRIPAHTPPAWKETKKSRNNGEIF